MKCSQVRRKLSAYLDGEVSERDKKEIDGHLQQCKGCQEELAALSGVSDSLGIMAGMEPPSYFMTRVRQCIREEVKPRPFLGKVRSIVFSAATAFAVVVSLLIGNQVGRILYQSVAATGESQTAETTDVFGLGTLDEFPDGSLSDIYNELVAGGNSG
jgi:anti-sigma factor RsiW